MLKDALLAPPRCFAAFLRCVSGADERVDSMKQSLVTVMKDAERTFRRNAQSSAKSVDSETSGWLSDNFYILERHARQAAEECKKAERKTKGSDMIPGLFERCSELCSKGILPDEEKTIEFFDKKGLSGIEAGFLPLAITCVLIDKAAKGVRNKEKSGAKQLANAITSLRHMGEFDFELVDEKLCAAENALNSDPAGIYSSMDSESKNFYRQRVAIAARKAGKSEKEFAKTILKKAEEKGRHIGEFIVSKRKDTTRGYVFLLMEIIMPLSISVAAGFFFAKLWVGLLLFFPLWELLRHPIESTSLKGVVPKRFLRLSVDDERVLNSDTLITVSTVMPSADKISDLEKHLEQIYLSNCMGNIKVCCLADFKAAGMPRRPEDRLMLKSLSEAVDRLNGKYGGGFIAAVRPRAYSETQNEFIGRERKRGAITELVRAVKGNSKGFMLLHGDTAQLEKVKYLICLDADTKLVFDSARELIAVAEHPINRPVIKNGRVDEGYGILVPRTENRLSGKNTTYFTAVMAGDPGVTAYDSLTCERYQDLFGEGIFSGKGLVNVDAYYELLDKGLPKEKILSHDIIESGYLRAGYLPDVQITEGFPQNVSSFYQRLHRWIRGDWQNIGFIFGKNPMNFLSRYKMFDNLRRSLTPALCLLAIGFSAVMQGYEGIFVAVAALFALASRNFYAGFKSLIHGGFPMLSRLYYSKTLPAALNAFVRTFVSVAFSAREAFVGISAAAAALWRLFVSKKKLLEWTTSAQSDAAKNGKEILACLPAVVASVFLFAVGLPIHRLIGLFILADIPLSLLSSVKVKKERIKLTEKQRENVHSYASAMWGFFEELCGKENNFLPPDNIQFSPVGAVARRTSPTNIGLMLTSFLAARDLGFITSAELYMRLNLSLGTVEKLEKYRGNLLNWYSTETLEPLNPRFVSTVDSGNFLCCLTALKEGLREYTAECAALNEIAERIEKIIDETDLAPLYNPRRRLFHIGIDPESGKKSESYYDLYMSEARMTAYFAVARRIVPKKHWGAMGRILVGQSRYTGLASWTGTMFEYFMPNIFIPAPMGSLTDESLHFCIYCQRKRAGKRPFGISESGFYAFDGSLNYQYKAHGVQKIGLKRGLDRETVISPYSTFLTLTTAPSASLKNLEKLEKMGMTGRYGFFEAADFTKGRNSGGFSVVRSFMAHHVGMSLLSADNLLKDQCMQKRFMGDSFMQGAESLLEEKVQTGATVFRDIKAEEIPQIRERVQGKNTVSENPSPFSPKTALFSNGRLTSCITDTGAGVCLFDGVDVTAYSGDLLSRPQGIFGVFVTEKERIPFVSAIDTGSGARFKAEFFKDKTEHTAQRSGIRLKMTTSVLKQKNCEKRRFVIENSNHKNTVKGRFLVYFDPCIEKRSAYGAHPAFSKLFLTDEWDEENKCFIFSRRSRDSKQQCAVAAGFAGDVEALHEASREKVLSTPRGVFSIGEKTDFTGERGNPDCCCAYSVEIELKPKEKKEFDFAIVAEETKELALNTFLTVKSGKASGKRSENPFYAGSFENAAANIALTSMLFPWASDQKTKIGSSCNFGRKDIWSFGLSGDLPIMLVEIDNEDEIETVRPYLRLNKILRNCGLPTDLAVSFRMEEGYSSPVTDALRKMMQDEDCLLMFGVSGGVHGADLSLHSYSECCALRESALFVAKSSGMVKNSVEKQFKALPFIDKTESKNKKSIRRNVKLYNFTDGEISIKKVPLTVDIPWNMVFANQSFGTMASDKALGFTWALNSRENKLTLWSNDAMSDNRGELLILKYNGSLYDLVAMGKAKFTSRKAEWETEIEKIKFKISVCVADRGMVKKCAVEAINNSSKPVDFELMYYTVPVLGAAPENSGTMFCKKIKNGIMTESSFGDFSGFSALTCDDEADLFCFSRADFFEGKFSENESHLSRSGCAAVGRRVTLNAGKKQKNSFYLSWGKTEKAAAEMAEVSSFKNSAPKLPKIKTGNKKISCFCNSFLYSQIKQSRFYGRTGFYQCSGAYGFRDQLQDSLAFLKTEPIITKRHIIRCAAVQFEQGDVLHWWHVILDKGQRIRGVRTRCSDDMLWLPFACLTYAEETGDLSIFDVNAPYITGAVLGEGETERYFSPERTDYKEKILEHCIKAVDFSLKLGKNGLPLIGSCDWNDGFSRIGVTQKSESVWLGMFQKIVLEGMADVCDRLNRKDKAEKYKQIAAKLEKTIESVAWQGDRYARVILEDGSFMGEKNDYIDILPQAFAVFAGLGAGGRAETALKTAYERLFDEKSGVIRLLSPSFEDDDIDSVGYIAAYPEGIRENGGQYTHAAVWLAAAMLEKGMNEEGQKLLEAINPMSFYDSEEKAKAYRAEPYVLAGDVSFGKGIAGRAGWTHFTGSAAWYYRTVQRYSNKIGE